MRPVNGPLATNRRGRGAAVECDTNGLSAKDQGVKIARLLTATLGYGKARGVREGEHACKRGVARPFPLPIHVCPGRSGAVRT